jgi:thiol-disulfide isomerase/thioredoxin
MIPLDEQMQFEDLWFGRATDKPFLVWFSAKWCKPCQRMVVEELEAAAATAGLPFYHCDITVNKYTPGYCDVDRFPTFIKFQPNKIVDRIVNSNTAAVCAWIMNP